MIKLTTRIPSRVCVAFSGGADSRFALDFVSRSRVRDVSAVHINHGTKDSLKYEKFCTSVCSEKGIPIVVHRIKETPEGVSKESFWHDRRYEIFNTIDCAVITGHNLDDAVEWWLMRAMLGRSPTLLSPERANVMRPFLRFSKRDILAALHRSGSCWIEDPTNEDGNLRAKIRHRIVNEVDELTSIRSIIRRKYDDFN